MFVDERDILLAFGLMLFMEGLLYAILPRDIIKRLFLYVAYLPIARLRVAALIAASFGFATIWYARRGSF